MHPSSFSSMILRQSRWGKHYKKRLQVDSALLVEDVVDELLKAFRREPGGTWICVEPTTFEGPNGRIQVARGTAFTPGSMFMGADLAKWLDERLAKLHKPTSH